jgi:hypothetical protein
MAFAGVLTAGSITQTLAPILMIWAEALCRIPANIDVIMTIKKTEKVIPTRSAANFPLSFTNNLYASFRIPFTVLSLSSYYHPL